MDYVKSEYQKQIRINDDQYKRIKEIKGKKSQAGKLKEIIDYYLKMHNI